MSDEPKWKTWTGRVLSALVVVGLLFSGTMKLSGNAEIVTAWEGTFGYPAAALMAVGIVEVLCAVLYAIPRTAVLGAILVTGYLGGAVATHVRISDVFVAPVILGIAAWAGLYLRMPRLRKFLPLATPTS